MKALTVKQPYAHLICAGIKDIENRTWNTKYRGRVYIHTGADKKLMNIPPSYFMTEEQCARMLERDVSFPKRDYELYSAIIGHVDIVNCISQKRNGKGSESIWAEPDYFHWILRNPVLFEHPIENVKGKLSFWDCSESINTTKNIER